MTSQRHCIIGAGYAGLAVAKAFTDAGLEHDHLEATERVGGNWAHRVYDSVQLITSASVTQYADHPMPRHYPTFPSAAQMLAYLEDYATRFGLSERIEFGTQVDACAPRDPRGMTGWRVRLASGEEREYASVVAATGHYWDKKIPEHPGTFTGRTVHSADYRNPTDLGERVLVVGGGNSACDIAVEAARARGRADISLRRGYWFVPRTVGGVPTAELANGWLPEPVERMRTRAGVRATIGDYRRYGLQMPEHDIFDQDVTVNTRIFDAFENGRVRPRRGIARFDGNTVHFTDGGIGEYDTIVWATGYHLRLPFLERLLEWQDGVPLLIGHTFAPGLANLTVQGLIAPRLGAGSLATKGSRLIADVTHVQQRLDVPFADVLGRLARPSAKMTAGAFELERGLDAARVVLRFVDRHPRAAARIVDGHQHLTVPRHRPPLPAGTAVVTGASSGIGEALAYELAERGHALLLIARRRERLHRLATELRAKHGIDVEVLPCDLADRRQRETLCRILTGRDISVICANAGAATFGELRDADSVREADQVELNVNALHQLVIALLPGLLRRNSGAVLVTGSTAGHLPMPGMATYAATKAFVNSFAEALHSELRDTGVTCTLLAPGPVHTEFAQEAGLDESAQSGDPTWLPARRVAAEALHGLARGKRIVSPGAMAKLQTAAARHVPHAFTLPALRTMARNMP
ncbi:SDR family NAD(P)-dependent oxidoreductase [Tsukamurella sp. 8F]|uniref:SDR family NAD(P)-dependent oxidoreductase n=1 Tax=unclassified Tsukamurella TaxID=2633480 RepID=UPI0023B8D484|nr:MULTISPECIES: SDR family NAD(P)-dependent oxidoreductase [unclassified Tsukamurella]MDF0531821.1 SDR family NAD(P)-dependent oxidoreductase [Tsukamurella sp. 8J]MDF0589063.1 SDR family NAD(P)-dependent oxidoreductase [Tsukamurella sp. 8F]